MFSRNRMKCYRLLKAAFDKKLGFWRKTFFFKSGRAMCNAYTVDFFEKKAFLTRIFNAVARKYPGGSWALCLF